ncbi:hypothetical protein CDV36_006921 [Fusarium kuroshium]|uniref:Uncharacterized protein n=1 Tax=Fusarium kuroshium TaxID=2010991 RepID=A0A3M2S771_9HYPO|nr:hypothetical protein CDV36_006921 [Fusarium kuroshium]
MEGIGAGLETGESLVGVNGLSQITEYSARLPWGQETADDLYEPLVEGCSSWDQDSSWQEISPTMETWEAGPAATHAGDMDLAPLPEALAEMGEPQGTLGEIQESVGDGCSSTPAEMITEMDYLADYDTCFGAASQVIVHATLNTFVSKTDGDLPLAVRASGNIINLYREADKLVGLFISDGLSSLPGQFPVHMTATLTPSSTQGLIRVVIYGLFEDRDLIGKHLSKANLYLQHPTLEEYEQSVKYFNPHLLLRPGATMPRIEDLSLQDDEPISPGPTVLDEVRQGKIWRIFDSASGGEVVPKVTASPRLKTTLEEHQLAALEMMIERECGVIKGAKFPTLWELQASAMNPR